MTDVSLAGAFLAGLVSFLSPCVLPLVPGYISMLSGIGMEELRKGEAPTSGLFASSLARNFAKEKPPLPACSPPHSLLSLDFPSFLFLLAPLPAP